jgi:hypothetical protein
MQCVYCEVRTLDSLKHDLAFLRVAFEGSESVELIYQQWAELCIHRKCMRCTETHELTVHIFLTLWVRFYVTHWP